MVAAVVNDDDNIPNTVTVPGRTLAQDVVERSLERMRTRAHYEWQAELACEETSR